MAYALMCVLAGMAAIAAGLFLPARIFLPKKKKYKERNPEGYVKSCRKALIYLGGYYIFLGLVVVFVLSNPIYVMLFKVLLPVLVMVPLVVIVKKYS